MSSGAASDHRTGLVTLGRGSVDSIQPPVAEVGPLECLYHGGNPGAVLVEPGHRACSASAWPSSGAGTNRYWTRCPAGSATAPAKSRSEVMTNCRGCGTAMTTEYAYAVSVSMAPSPRSSRSTYAAISRSVRKISRLRRSSCVARSGENTERSMGLSSRASPLEVSVSVRACIGSETARSTAIRRSRQSGGMASEHEARRPSSSCPAATTVPARTAASGMTTIWKRSQPKEECSITMSALKADTAPKTVGAARAMIAPAHRQDECGEDQHDQERRQALDLTGEVLEGLTHGATGHGADRVRADSAPARSCCRSS